MAKLTQILGAMPQASPSSAPTSIPYLTKYITLFHFLGKNMVPEQTNEMAKFQREGATLGERFQRYSISNQIKLIQRRRGNHEQ